jgi:hypothetical protein
VRGPQIKIESHERQKFELLKCLHYQNTVYIMHGIQSGKHKKADFFAFENIEFLDCFPNYYVSKRDWKVKKSNRSKSYLLFISSFVYYD